MIAVIDAQLAWCPPTFSPSALSRMWLAWWIVQADRKRSLSSRILRASMSAGVFFSMAARSRHPPLASSHVRNVREVAGHLGPGAWIGDDCADDTDHAHDESHADHHRICKVEAQT